LLSLNVDLIGGLRTS